MRTTGLTNERGMASLIAIIMVGLLTLLGIAALQTSDDEVSIAGNEMQEMKAFYAAEAGLEQAAATLQEEYEATNAPPTTMPAGNDTINHCVVAYNTSDDGAPTTRELTQGTLAGLHALVKSFSINSTGVSLGEKGRVDMSQSFETALIPLFQFAVFYGNDLEIAPGADMNLVGRVHSNGNLWVQANNTLRMDSYVTCSGSMLHGRKGPEPVSNGDVLIKNASGNYVSMKQGSGWLEHTDAEWFDSSISRWGGRVQDAAHGQGELNLPLNGSSDPHKIIEPAAGGNADSYELKSTVKIVNGQAYNKVGGVWTNVTATFTTLGILTYTADKFKDQREGKKVDVTDLDVGKLYANGYGPSNGVVYFSDDIGGSTEWPALRLKNAATLGSGLTVASQNPVYTLGNYNTVNKKPAAIISDAITFLSASWNDIYGDSSKTKRVAQTTTINASYVTGNTETTPTNYNGGFENLPRFLETWSGKTLNWLGSAVNLWNSRQAVGKWNGTYYDPPSRSWVYDTDLDDPNKLPPETPMVRVFQRTGWKQEFVGE